LKETSNQTSVALFLNIH